MSVEAAPVPVSVVLCTRNRPALARDAVGSILDGRRVPEEIVVVDQSDLPDGELAGLVEVRGCRIRYLPTQSRGLSRAANEGIAAAASDTLVFTHDDVHVAADWLETLAAALDEAGAEAIVTGRVQAAETDVAGGFQLTLNTEEAPAVYTGRLDRDVLYPLNMALRRPLAASLGGFDPRLGPGTPYPGAEDSDLAFRALESGVRIVYVPSAVVFHREWRPPSEYVRLRWSYGVARGGFYAKHLRGPARGHIRARLRTDVRGHLVGGILGLRRAPRRALGDVALAAGICAGAVRWLVLGGR